MLRNAPGLVHNKSLTHFGRHFEIRLKRRLAFRLCTLPFGGGEIPPRNRHPTRATSSHGSSFQHQFNPLRSAGINADVHSWQAFLHAADSGQPQSIPVLATQRFGEHSFHSTTADLQNVFNPAPKWQGHFNLQGSDEIGDNNSILDNVYSSRSTAIEAW